MSYTHDVDWIVETARVTGMQVSKIAVLDLSVDDGFRTRLGEDLNVEEGYDLARRDGDIDRYEPDVFVSNYESSNKVRVCDTIPMCPDVGYFSGLALARRWASAMSRPSLQGSWSLDEALYRKRYLTTGKVRV
jgi:hypothetical protein